MYFHDYSYSTPKQRKAIEKAFTKTAKMNDAADYAIIRSLDESVADALLHLVERIVRYNGNAKDYDMALHELLYEVEGLMRRKPEGE